MILLIFIVGAAAVTWVAPRLGTTDDGEFQLAQMTIIGLIVLTAVGLIVEGINQVHASTQARKRRIAEIESGHSLHDVSPFGEISEPEAVRTLDPEQVRARAEAASLRKGDKR